MGIGGLWLFLIAVVAMAITSAVGSRALASRLLNESAAAKYSSALAPFLTTVALVYGALLGFTVVVAWEQFSSAEANVTNESSTLATMYRQTVGMPVPQQKEMRKLLRTYTASVQGEWDRQEGEDASETARHAITGMYRVVGEQQTGANLVNAEIIGQLTVLTSQRNVRILDGRPRIPGLLWAGMLFGGALLIVLMGFTRLDSKLGHLLLSSAVAGLLGLLMFIVFWLDHPFGRHIGVTPQPIEQAVLVFDQVDQGS
jgi:hypothetical protein